MTFEIVVEKDFAGVKPKNFLKKRLNCPFFKLPQLLKNKRITIGGKKIHQDYVLKQGDIIKIWLDELKLETEYVEKKAKDLKIPVIFENEDFIVFNKPVNISVQGGMELDKKLCLHLEFLKQKNRDFSDFSYFHVHRLDKQTSGVLVVAKNRVTLREFNQIFRERGVEKKYLCLCSGKFEKNCGRIEEFLARTEQNTFEKVVVVQSKEHGIDTKNSISQYRVLKEVKFDDEIFSLVEVEIKTGVTHQIRVHMKHIGHPIVGDQMYGNSNTNKIFSEELTRQFLHAKSLKFNFNEENFHFEADLSKDLLEVLKKIKIKF